MDAKRKVSPSFKKTFSKFGRDPIGGDPNDTSVHEIAILHEIATPQISDIGKTSILLEISSTKRNIFNCDSMWMLMLRSKNLQYRKNICQIRQDAHFSS
jgi:hypothetical protein